MLLWHALIQLPTVKRVDVAGSRCQELLEPEGIDSGETPADAKLDATPNEFGQCATAWPRHLASQKIAMEVV